MTRQAGGWLVVGLLALLGGCQADPSSWHGPLKRLNVHAVAFTAQGRGLLLVGPRVGQTDQPNTTAYYHLNLERMAGQRLGYGQYALGQALICPFAEWAALPAYLPAADGAGDRPGYELYDLVSGRLISRTALDDPSQFVAPLAGPTPATQPDPAALLAAWARIVPTPLSASQRDQVSRFAPRWVSRDSRSDPAAKTEQLDGQRFFVLDSPDGRHRLYIRFRAPRDDPAEADDPAGEGLAHGFLLDPQTGMRYMLFSTTATDEWWAGVGAVVVGGPVWLVQQPFKWIRGQ